MTEQITSLRTEPKKMERNFKFRVVHLISGEVFAEFAHEIHVKMFYNSFSKCIKIDDFMKIEKIEKEKNV